MGHPGRLGTRKLGELATWPTQVGLGGGVERYLQEAQVTCNLGG